MRDRSRPGTPAEIVNRLFAQGSLRLPGRVVITASENQSRFPFVIVATRRRLFGRSEQVASSRGTTRVDAFRGLGPLWSGQITSRLRRKDVNK
ncbi:MAG TPA: hypothetical protein VLF20_03480 [Patescibacteria group bacterium]|nr:hypothetical protein [Patescibacteria group bacterium]